MLGRPETKSVTGAKVRTVTVAVAFLDCRVAALLAVTKGAAVLTDTPIVFASEARRSRTAACIATGVAEGLDHGTQ